MKTTFVPDLPRPGKPLANRASPRLDGRSPEWTRHLPEGWRETVEAPLHFRLYREYEMSAERTVGYDGDDKPCFAAHHFQLTSLASDDDEEFYEIVTYAEEMAAWRLRDERWLIYRAISTNGCNAARSFYAFSADMPR
ncbi:MAG TPA: hypothetical protein VN639_10505 [Azonexus sp.]|nr:hypothetical protein [Azonexus sp.]